MFRTPKTTPDCSKRTFSGYFACARTVRALEPSVRPLVVAGRVDEGVLEGVEVGTDLRARCDGDVKRATGDALMALRRRRSWQLRAVMAALTRHGPPRATPR
jgi:hypothetical protein